MKSNVISLIDWSFNGLVKNDFHLINSELDILSNTTYLAKLKLNIPYFLKVIKSYIEIYALPADLRYAKWKLWLNSFPLTKEFRPNFIFETKNRSHSLFIYDVTPVIMRDYKKRTHKLVIKNIGSTPIYIGYALLIVELEFENAKTHHMYDIGFMECKKDSPCYLRTASCDSHNYSKTETIIRGYTAHSPIAINLRSRNFERKVVGSIPIIDVILQECSEGGLEMTPDPEQGSFYLLSYNSFSSLYPRPIIETVVHSAGEESRRQRLDIKVRNVGEAPALNVMVIGFLHGNTLFVRRIETIDPNNEATFTEPIEIHREPGPITIRTVWNEFGEIYFRDLKVRL